MTRSITSCGFSWFGATCVLTVLVTIAHANAASPGQASARANFEAVVPAIERETGENVQSRFPFENHPQGNQHCPNETFCEGFIGELRIETFPRRIDVAPSPRTPPEILVGSCVGVLHAFLENASAQEVRSVVQHALERVLNEGVATLEAKTFEFEMKLSPEDLPSCRLTRFVER